MSLEIKKGKQQHARRMMLYGVHGWGKSTLASQFPDPIFLDTEDGLSDIDCHKFDRALLWADLLEQTDYLLREEHEYKTVVLDSADWAERLAWVHTADEHNKESIEGIPYGRGYQLACDHWRELLGRFDRLRQDGVTVVLIAHSENVKCYPPDADSYDRYQPKLHTKTTSPLLQEWCDEVLFCAYRVLTKTEDLGFGKKKHRAIGSERIIRCSEKAAWIAKNRLGMPEEIQPQYDVLRKYMSGTQQVLSKVESPF